MDELIVDVAYRYCDDYGMMERHENAGHSSKTRQATRASPQSRLLPAAVKATRTDKVSSSEGLIERGRPCQARIEPERGRSPPRQSQAKQEMALALLFPGQEPWRAVVLLRHGFIPVLDGQGCPSLNHLR
ncbi:hypothetical protein VDGL01_10375 [Verticillium dahliae]